MPESHLMNGKDLIKTVRRLGRTGGVDVSFVQHRGKGSHGTLYYGDRYVVLPDRKRDIGPRLLNHISETFARVSGRGIGGPDRHFPLTKHASS